jgi:hypothetical protein
LVTDRTFIDVDATVSDSEIEITVVTSVATKKGYKLILPGDSRGEYAVYYQDPDGVRHQIGEVRIEE